MKNLGPHHQPTSNNEDTNFRIWLQQQFTSRCKRNPRYSLRAFANFLEMDASSVSQIFSRKRKASTKVISNVCNLLGASPQIKDTFIHQAKASFKCNSKNSLSQNISYDLLAQDAFDVISDWYHFAILELINVDGFQSRPAWCAKALSISTAESQMALERLVRLGLVRFENNRLVRTSKLITNFVPGMTSAAHRNMQRQILQMAIDAIDEATPEEKDITGMTMAIDPQKIPQARKMITKFRRQMSAFLEDGQQSRVYQLAVQLYPISNNIKPIED